MALHKSAIDSIDSLKNQIQVHLDVLPYLNSIDWSQQYQGNSSHSSERIDLLACLSEIDLAINRTQTSKGHQRLFSTHLDDLTWRCLISSALRIRAHLRQYAADDLERLNRLLRRQLINNSHPQPVSSISTRNLVDDGVPIVDTLDNQRQQSIQSESPGQPSSNQDGLTSIISQIPAANTGGFRGLFAGAYKDAVGKALTIVVGTGLSIFLVNLLVILTIAWRSARARRRAEQTRVHDSGAIPVGACVVIQQNGSFDQPMKKPNLKKSNLQQSCAGGFANGSLDGLQLNSLINCKQTNSEHRAKHLKFDLPNISNGIVDQELTLHTETLPERGHHGAEQQVCANESVFASSIEALDMNQHHHHHRQQQVYMADTSCAQAVIGDGTCESEVLLSAEPLLDDYYANLDERAEPVLLGEQLNIRQDPYGLPQHQNRSSLHWNLPDEPSPARQVDQCPVQNHRHRHHHHQFCGLNASPMTNQSQSTATTATTTSTNMSANLLHNHAHNHNHTYASHYGHHQMMNRSTIQRPIAPSHKSQLNRQQQQHPLYLDHSTASPSSSTTLSMTPIQLESLTAITGGVSNGQYQLEPIGMIYQASELSQLVNSTTHLPSDQQQQQQQHRHHHQEDFLADKMFLISSADSALPVSDAGEMSQSCLKDDHDNDFNH